MLPRALRVATESERGRQQTCEFANERDEAMSESERYGGDSGFFFFIFKKN